MEEKRPSSHSPLLQFRQIQWQGPINRGRRDCASLKELFHGTCRNFLSFPSSREEIAIYLGCPQAKHRRNIFQLQGPGYITRELDIIPNIVDRAHLSSDSLGDDLVIWIKFSPCRDCFFNVTVPFAIYPPPPSPPLPSPPRPLLSFAYFITDGWDACAKYCAVIHGC